MALLSRDFWLTRLALPEIVLERINSPFSSLSGTHDCAPANNHVTNCTSQHSYHYSQSKRHSTFLTPSNAGRRSKRRPSPPRVVSAPLKLVSSNKLNHRRPRITSLPGIFAWLSDCKTTGRTVTIPTTPRPVFFPHSSVPPHLPSDPCCHNPLAKNSQIQCLQSLLFIFVPCHSPGCVHCFWSQSM